MKILFINHFPLTGSGSGVYTANLAKSLSKKGHEVAIVFPENQKDYEQYENIELYPVFFKNDEVIKDEEQLNMNFPCFTTHPRSTFNFKNMTDEEQKQYEIAFKNKIDSVIKEFKPDIIHAQHLWTLAGISALCAKENNIPLVVTCHGTDLIGIQEEINLDKDWGTRWAVEAIEYADYIITVSKDNNKIAHEILKGTFDKTILIKNGVDSKTFFKDKSIKRESVLNSLNINKDYKYVIGFVGKLTYLKGVDVLLEAANIYENDNILTLIAGDGELRKDLEEQANKLNLKNVVFLGNLPQTKLNEIYNILDCLVIPSRQEAFGLVAAEALICGAPVIATNEGGLPDFVTRDVGILINSDNKDELAQAVASIINKEKIFNREYIATKIEEKHSQDSLINKFEKLYEKVIKEAQINLNSYDSIIKKR